MLQYYTIPQIVKAIQYKRENRIENYDAYSDAIGSIARMYQMAWAFLLLILLIVVILWLFAFYKLLTNWKRLPLWVAILCLIALFPLGPIGAIITLIVVYTMAKTETSQTIVYQAEPPLIQ